MKPAALLVAASLVAVSTTTVAQNCPYDPRCSNNPYGAGNPYKPDGLMNPYSAYGSLYSNQHPRAPGRFSNRV